MYIYKLNNLQNITFSSVFAFMSLRNAIHPTRFHLSLVLSHSIFLYYLFYLKQGKKNTVLMAITTYNFIFPISLSSNIHLKTHIKKENTTTNKQKKPNHYGNLHALPIICTLALLEAGMTFRIVMTPFSQAASTVVCSAVYSLKCTFHP